MLFEGLNYDQILDKVVHSDMVPVYSRAANRVLEDVLRKKGMCNTNLCAQTRRMIDIGMSKFWKSSACKLR